jgi:adenine C2-methylase RlmN of 23S rRNA A2503 and tRNA A37
MQGPPFTFHLFFEKYHNFIDFLKKLPFIEKLKQFFSNEKGISLMDVPPTLSAQYFIPKMGEFKEDNKELIDEIHKFIEKTFYGTQIEKVMPDLDEMLALIKKIFKALKMDEDKIEEIINQIKNEVHHDLSHKENVWKFIRYIHFFTSLIEMPKEIKDQRKKAA